MIPKQSYSTCLISVLFFPELLLALTFAVTDWISHNISRSDGASITGILHTCDFGLMLCHPLFSNTLIRQCTKGGNRSVNGEGVNVDLSKQYIFLGLGKNEPTRHL
jgi:hypothetical protein